MVHKSVEHTVHDLCFLAHPMASISTVITRLTSQAIVSTAIVGCKVTIDIHHLPFPPPITVLPQLLPVL